MTQLWNSKREEEENINKRKLLYDGHGTGDDRKLLALIKAITKFCLVNDEPQSVEEIDKSNAQINQYIQQSIFASERIERMLQVCQEDLKVAYEKIAEEQIDIAKAQSDIEKARLDLEYEAKIKIVKSMPSCSSTQQKIIDLQEKRRQLAARTIKHQKQLENIAKICDEFETMLNQTDEFESIELQSNVVTNGNKLH